MAWQQLTDTYQRLLFLKSLHKTMKKISPNVLALVGVKLYKNWRDLQASERLAKTSELSAPPGNTIIETAFLHAKSSRVVIPIFLPERKKKKNQKGKQNKGQKQAIKKSKQQNKTYFTNWQGPLCCSKQEQDSCRVCPTQSQAKITWDQRIQLGCCDNRGQDVWHSKIRS